MKQHFLDFVSNQVDMMKGWVLAFMKHFGVSVSDLPKEEDIKILDSILYSYPHSLIIKEMFFDFLEEKKKEYIVGLEEE